MASNNVFINVKIQEKGYRTALTTNNRVPIKGCQWANGHAIQAGPS